MNNLFIVRLWDGGDGLWIDVSKAISKIEAEKIWNKETENGTINKCYADGNYYQIFPANTTMLYRSGGAFPGRTDNLENEE